MQCLLCVLCHSSVCLHACVNVSYMCRSQSCVVLRLESAQHDKLTQVCTRTHLLCALHGVVQCCRDYASHALFEVTVFWHLVHMSCLPSHQCIFGVCILY